MKIKIAYLLIMLLLVMQSAFIVSSYVFNLSSLYLMVSMIYILSFCFLLIVCSFIAINNNQALLGILLLIWAFVIGMLLGLSLPKRIAAIGWIVVFVPSLSSILFALWCERRRKQRGAAGEYNPLNVGGTR